MRHDLGMIWLGRCGLGTVRVIALGALVWPLLAEDAAVEVPAESAPSAPVEKPLAGKSEYARKIAVRNAFALQDPVPVTPPAPPLPPPPPPTPKSTVQLTGFSRWGGERKVYLVVTKPGAKSPEYIDLREGDERGDIKVLQIDDRSETAQIVNTGVEETLNFKDNGAKPTGGGGPVPNVAGMPNPGVPVQGVPPPPNLAQNRFGNNVPTVVGRGGGNVIETPVVNPSSPQGLPINNTAVHPPEGIGGGGGGIPGNISQPGGTGQPAQMGQNPTVNRSRIFNIPPPPLPPGN